MIVDCHTHIFEAGRGGPFDIPCGAEDLVRQMDEHKVDVSIVLPLPGDATNEFVHKECCRFPDRLVGLYTPEFDVPAETLARMESFFEQYSARGLKIHPRRQGVSVEQPLVRQTLAWAAKRAIPVLFDVFPFGPSLGDFATYPVAYHKVAQELPDLKMVLAHAGGYRLMDAFIVAKSNPGVHLDLSFTPVYFKGSSIAADFGFLCKRMPAGRILYGSDFPSVPFADSLEASMLFLEGVDSEKRRQVMGQAAADLFGINGSGR
jgi:predicted TIM-barrel fold metal-dependent hydrolase